MIQQQPFSKSSNLFDNGSLPPHSTKTADARTKEKRTVASLSLLQIYGSRI